MCMSTIFDLFNSASNFTIMRNRYSIRVFIQFKEKNNDIGFLNTKLRKSVIEYWDMQYDAKYEKLYNGIFLDLLTCLRHNVASRSL